MYITLIKLIVIEKLKVKYIVLDRYNIKTGDICRSESVKMGNSWVREFRDGTAQTPGSVTPQQDSKVGDFSFILEIFSSNWIFAANL